jgi:hypothetical protein
LEPSHDHDKEPYIINGFENTAKRIHHTSCEKTHRPCVQPKTIFANLQLAWSYLLGLGYSYKNEALPVEREPVMPGQTFNEQYAILLLRFITRSLMKEVWINICH